MSQDRVEFYSLGLGIALVLDQLTPDWKARYTREDVWTDDLLFEAIADREGVPTCREPLPK